jgi:microcystin-dependent protein
VAMGVGGGFQLGNTTGEETHTLTSNEMPLHQHPVSASAVVGTQAVAAGNLLGNAAMYNASPPDPAASTDNLIAAVGGSQPHENRPPYLVMTWIIALQGIFPSRN